jgi:hypothetical protein
MNPNVGPIPMSVIEMPEVITFEGEVALLLNSAPVLAYGHADAPIQWWHWQQALTYGVGCDSSRALLLEFGNKDQLHHGQ